MSRVTRDRKVESISRDQVLRRERGQGNVHFPCSGIGNTSQLIHTLLEDVMTVQHAYYVSGK